jgi:hypothetical protein
MCDARSVSPLNSLAVILSEAERDMLRRRTNSTRRFRRATECAEICTWRGLDAAGAGPSRRLHQANRDCMHLAITAPPSVSRMAEVN